MGDNFSNLKARVSERNPIFDYLKFFAIFMVLWGHSIQHLSSTEYYDEPVYRIIYSFHMPLFMTIVGYFSVGKSESSLRDSILKKVRQLLLPALSFGVILFIVLSYEDGLKAGFTQWVYGLWFLKSAFGCAVIYFIGCRVFKRESVWIILTLLISQFIFVYKINLMYPCFLFGIVLNKNISFVKEYSSLLTVASGILFLTMLFYWNADFWLYPDDKIKFGIQSCAEYYYFNGYRVIIGLIGTLFFISLFYYICSRFRFPEPVKKLSQYGQETLGIYLLQTFLLELLLPRFLNLDKLDFITFNFIATPAISLIILVLCMVIIKLIKKSPLLSVVLLGKKLKNNNEMHDKL